MVIERVGRYCHGIVDCVRQLRSGVLEEVERLGGEGAAEMSDLQEKEERLQLQLTCLLEDIQAFKNTALAKVIVAYYRVECPCKDALIRYLKTGNNSIVNCWTTDY